MPLTSDFSIYSNVVDPSTFTTTFYPINNVLDSRMTSRYTFYNEQNGNGLIYGDYENGWDEEYGHACVFLTGSPFNSSFQPNSESARSTTTAINNLTTFGFRCQAPIFDSMTGTNKPITICMWWKPIYQNVTQWFTYLRFGPKVTNQEYILGGKYNKNQNYKKTNTPNTADFVYGGNEGKNIGCEMGIKRYLTSVEHQPEQWLFQAVTYFVNNRGNKVLTYLNRREPGHTPLEEPAPVNIKNIGREYVNMDLKMGSDYLRVAQTNRQCDPRYLHDIRIFNKQLSPAELLWLCQHHC